MKNEEFSKNMLKIQKYLKNTKSVLKIQKYLLEDFIKKIEFFQGKSKIMLKL